jgi:hypothetical protein
MAWIDSRYLDQQRKLEREVLQLRREWDELKLEITARRTAARREVKAARIAFEKLWHDLQRSAEQKAGFNPDQPRDDHGKWTDAGGGDKGPADDTGKPERILLAGEIPTSDPPEVPKERPTTSEGRTEIVKNVARWLGRFGGPLAKVAGAAYWLYQYDAQITASLDPPKSLDELQRAVASPKAGYEIHHIVEQTPAEQHGYRRSLIDGPDNLVRIPTLKHREITGWYQTINDDYGDLSPRDYLRGKTWEERTKVGLKALIDVGVLKP